MGKIRTSCNKQSILFFALGCLVSGFSFLLIFIIEFTQEGFIINKEISLKGIFNSTVYCFFVALLEELVFRYLFLRKWIRNKYKPFSVSILYLGLISSLIFGFLHLKLDEFPLYQINITLSGISLFYATYKFRNISIAIGMHFSWNFIQGVIFSFSGSGTDLENLFIMENKIMTSPEESHYMVFAVMLEILLVWLLSKSKVFSIKFPLGLPQGY